ncbi:MAG: hypothetical protein QM487_11425 [Candidatus Marithrix sp.]
MKIILLLILVILPLSSAMAHHILGRPTYSLNEDSNTLSSMQVETHIGSYFINYIVFPAFPRPNEPGKINLYATNISTNQLFAGQIIFKVRNNSWFNSNEKQLGIQTSDDNIFRQNFIFSRSGNYIITAIFEANNEPYIIDFPLQIGRPPPIGSIGITVAVIVLILLGVSIIQRKNIHNACIDS